MKYKIALFVTLVSFQAFAVCPDLTKKESSLDCPWAQITRQFADGQLSCKKVFNKETPSLNKQLAKDSTSLGFLNLWGQAKNFDDNAKAIIVNSKMVDCLADKLKIKNATEIQDSFEIVHAGLQHTYAYLFSNLETPYGYKRLRWTTDDIQDGLNLPTDTLRPTTKNGSFLTHVTYVFSKLAFQQDTKLFKKLETEGLKNKSLSKELIKLDQAAFSIQNLNEAIPNKNITLHTTFVKFKSENMSSKNTHLLIYWYENKLENKKYLITGFPVEASFVEQAFETKKLGQDQPIKTRYNAWIPGVTNSKEPLFGERQAVQ